MTAIKTIKAISCVGSYRATYSEKEIRRGSNKAHHLSPGIFSQYLPTFCFVIMSICVCEEHWLESSLIKGA